METVDVRPIKTRVYQNIDLTKIKVINSREREQSQFQNNVRSIDEVGLLVPVVVNGRYLQETGYYELVCGEGRVLAHQTLGHTQIRAEVIDCDRKGALLFSLVENIARVTPGTMWFAREVKRLHDSGWTVERIARLVGKIIEYVRAYIGLAEQGEDRLIQAVERGVIPISLAVEIARSDNSTAQHVLMDAFDKGILNSGNFPTVRRIVELRIDARKRTRDSHPTTSGAPLYSVKQLRNDIARITREKEAFVREAGVKENRLLTLLQDLHQLRKSEAFGALARAEGLDQLPALNGAYTV